MTGRLQGCFVEFLFACKVARITAFQIENEEFEEDYNADDVSQRCNDITDNLRVTLQVVV